MGKSGILIFISISFAAGVLSASVFDLPAEPVHVLLAAAACLFFIFLYFGKKTSALLALFLFCACAGALRLAASMGDNQYGGLLDSKQTFEGYVIEDPGVKQNNQLVTFRPDGFSQNIQLNTNLTQNFFYGDRVVVTGKIQEAKNLGDFDYASYLERYNIYAVMNYPKALILKSHQLNKAKEFLLRIKYAFIARTEGLFLEPQSSLALGILIGGHGSLPKDIVDNFNNTGTSHIIAVSGFNITIIAGFLSYSAYLLGRRASFYLSLVTISGFVVIAGLSASVVRAAIMGFLFLLSMRSGRQYSVAPSLFFAALIMLLINPRILFWDAGFQLSFAATLGLVYFSPLLQSLAENWPKFFGIKLIVLSTVSAIIATMPIILFNFGTLSLSAPIVNVLVLPLIPAAMFFGFFSVLPFVGPGFALIAGWLLVYILKVTDIFAHLPYSYLSFRISPLVFWLMVCGVFILYFGLRFLSKKLTTREDDRHSPKTQGV